MLSPIFLSTYLYIYLFTYLSILMDAVYLSISIYQWRSLLSYGYPGFPILSSPYLSIFLSYHLSIYPDGSSEGVYYPADTSGSSLSPLSDQLNSFSRGNFVFLRIILIIFSLTLVCPSVLLSNLFHVPHLYEFSLLALFPIPTFCLEFWILAFCLNIMLSCSADIFGAIAFFIQSFFSFN